MAQVDQISQNRYGIPELVLMENAGRSAFSLLEQRGLSPQNASFLVFAGKGNNGGDALVMARLAWEKGYPVGLVNPHRQGASSWETQLRICRALGIPEYETIPQQDFSHLIDGYLGTGLSGPLRPEARQWIEKIQEFKGSIISLDLPSGLGDTSRDLFVHPDLTITMGGHKSILFHPKVRPYRGELLLADPGFPHGAFQDISPEGWLLEEDDLSLPGKDPFTHKGKRGTLRIWGGSPGMEGAALLCGGSAGRVGAGLVTIHTSIPQDVKGRCRDHFLMIRPDEEDIPEKTSALVIGPGWGRQKGRPSQLRRLLQRNLPTLLDADALFALTSLLEEEPDLSLENCLLTPHMGEGARLMGCSLEDLKRDPDGYIKPFCQKHRCWLLLKDFTTRLYSPGEPVIILDKPNPALSTGGTGDVLAGLIGGLLARGLSIRDAALQGLLIHSGTAQMVADDLMAGISAFTGRMGR